MSALPRSLTDKIRTDNRLTELCDVFKVLERGSLNLVFGSVYAVYSPSGKVYIGQTTQSMKARKRGHVFCANSPNSHGYNTKFSRAVRKYDSSLVWKILHRAVPEYALVALEKLEIKRHQSVKKGCNSIWSGSRTTTVWTKKRKMRQRQRMLGTKNPFAGRTHTPEARAAMSARRKGRKRSVAAVSKQAETIKGSGNPMFGRRHSAPARQSMSTAKRKVWTITTPEKCRLLFNGIEEVDVFAKKYVKCSGRHLYNYQAVKGFSLCKS